MLKNYIMFFFAIDSCHWMVIIIYILEKLIGPPPEDKPTSSNPMSHSYIIMYTFQSRNIGL